MEEVKREECSKNMTREKDFYVRDNGDIKRKAVVYSKKLKEKEGRCQ